MVAKDRRGKTEERKDKQHTGKMVTTIEKGVP